MRIDSYPNSVLIGSDPYIMISAKLQYGVTEVWYGESVKLSN